ncbi:contractile injection system tape measure protein [Flammeovirga sp. SJP92]|uniref:contractile injection system tape measure protein n=1 Tax=Flammeovirga sp. SJP92 TaxID=1775430 RepID=UPI00078798F2|nr:contractile injection system tape measure protein [Flammeovirga sp. SJP92]KXX68956.1 hypothetical protein AVL50_17500 [Flammeovirga sp. SJP92]
MNELVKVNIDFISEGSLHEGIIKLELTNFIESQLLPMVEKEVDKYADSTIYIDQLNIALSSTILNYQKDTYSTVQRVLSDKLHEYNYRITADNKSAPSSVEEILKRDRESFTHTELSKEECLLVFLTTGIMPWYDQDRLKEELSKIENKNNLSVLTQVWHLMCLKKKYNVYSFLAFINKKNLLDDFLLQLLAKYPLLRDVLSGMSKEEKKIVLLQVYNQGVRSSDVGETFQESILRAVLKRNFKPSIVDTILNIVNSNLRLTELCKVELMLYIKKQRNKLRRGLFVKEKKVEQQLLLLEESLCSKNSKLENEIEAQEVEEDVLTLMEFSQWKASFIEQQVLSFLLKKELDPAFESQLSANPILLFQFLLVIVQRTNERKIKGLKKFPQLYFIGDNAIIHQLLFAIIKDQPEGFLNSKLIQQVTDSTEIAHVRTFLISSLGEKLDVELRKVLTYELLLLKLLLSPEQLLKKSIKFDQKWAEVLEYFNLFSSLTKEEKTQLLLSSTSLETIFVLALQSESTVFLEQFDQKIIAKALFTDAQKVLKLYQFYNRHSFNAPITSEEFVSVIVESFPSIKNETSMLIEFDRLVNDLNIPEIEDVTALLMDKPSNKRNDLKGELKEVFDHFKSNSQLTKLEKTNFLLSTVTEETIFGVILQKVITDFFEIFDEVQIGLALFSDKKSVTALYQYYTSQEPTASAEDFVKVIMTFFPSFRSKGRAILQSLELENEGNTSPNFQKEDIAFNLKQLLQTSNSIHVKRADVVSFFKRRPQVTKQERTIFLLSSASIEIILELIISSEKDSSTAQFFELFDRITLGSSLLSKKNDVIKLYQFFIDQSNNNSVSLDDFVEVISDYFPTFETQVRAILEYNEIVGGIQYIDKEKNVALAIDLLHKQSERINKQLVILMDYLKKDLKISKKKRTKLLLSTTEIEIVFQLFSVTSISSFFDVFSRKLIGTKLFSNAESVQSTYQLYLEYFTDKKTEQEENFIQLVTNEFPAFEDQVRSVIQKKLAKNASQLTLEQILKQSVSIEEKREDIITYFKLSEQLSKGEKTKLLISSASIVIIMELIIAGDEKLFFTLFDKTELGNALFANNTTIITLYQFFSQQQQYNVKTTDEFVKLVAKYFPTLETKVKLMLGVVSLNEGVSTVDWKDFIFSDQNKVQISFSAIQSQKVLIITNLVNSQTIQLDIEENVLGITYLREIFELHQPSLNSTLQLINAINAIVYQFKEEDRKKVEAMIDWVKEGNTELISKTNYESISSLEIQLWLQLIINRKEGLFDLEQKEALIQYFKKLHRSELDAHNSYSVRQKNKIFCYLSLSYKTSFAKQLQKLEQNLNQTFSKLFTAIQIADYIKLLQNDIFYSLLHQDTLQAGLIVKRIETVFPQINFSRTKIYKITCELLKLTIDNKHIEELNDKFEQSIPQRKNMTIEVQNAGLIILVPYLPLFLKHQGLLTEDNKAFKDEESLLKAIGLLLYLAQKNLLVDDDRQLILPKILCGVDIETPITLDFELTDEEKEGADHLLKTVITHWGALKKMEPDSLRIMFFIRDGQITFKDDWYLDVEPNTYDIFMKMLPWSIKINMLPWMECKIFCEWGK